MSQIVHRFRVRLRSGEGVSELETLAVKDVSSFRTDHDRQRFLRDMFMQGYALYRSGLLKDPSMLGVAVEKVEQESPAVTEGGSTVNPMAKQKLGSLFDEDLL